MLFNLIYSIVSKTSLSSLPLNAYKTLLLYKHTEQFALSLLREGRLCHFFSFNEKYKQSFDTFFSELIPPIKYNLLSKYIF